MELENNGGKENNLEEELEHDALNKNNPKKFNKVSLDLFSISIKNKKSSINKHI